MSGNKVEVKKQAEKLTYEQLNALAQQLSLRVKDLTEQNKKLEDYCRESDYQNLYKRTDYLFTIIESDNKYLSEEFKRACAKEIESLLTRPKTEE